MKTEEILDNDLLEQEEGLYKEAVQWWENKRAVYNYFLVAVLAFIAFSYWEGVIQYGRFAAAFGSMGYILVANVLYSLGTAIEVIFIYRFDMEFPRRLRFLCFIGGFMISLMMTLDIYINVLRSFY